MHVFYKICRWNILDLVLGHIFRNPRIWNGQKVQNSSLQRTTCISCVQTCFFHRYTASKIH